MATIIIPKEYNNQYDSVIFSKIELKDNIITIDCSVNNNTYTIATNNITTITPGVYEYVLENSNDDKPYSPKIIPMYTHSSNEKYAAFVANKGVRIFRLTVNTDIVLMQLWDKRVLNDTVIPVGFDSIIEEDLSKGMANIGCANSSFYKQVYDLYIKRNAINEQIDIYSTIQYLEEQLDAATSILLSLINSTPININAKSILDYANNYSTLNKKANSDIILDITTNKKAIRDISNT